MCDKSVNFSTLETRVLNLEVRFKGPQIRGKYISIENG